MNIGESTPFKEAFEKNMNRGTVDSLSEML
jgi:hypothetical protein